MLAATGLEMLFTHAAARPFPLKNHAKSKLPKTEVLGFSSRAKIPILFVETDLKDASIDFERPMSEDARV